MINPDNESEIIINTKASCAFIYQYCKERGLTLEEYKTAIEGTMPVVVLHLQKQKINFYVIHGLNCENTFRSLESELLEFIITEYNKQNRKTRQEFIKSTTLKTTTRKALHLIEQLLQHKTKKHNE